MYRNTKSSLCLPSHNQFCGLGVHVILIYCSYSSVFELFWIGGWMMLVHNTNANVHTDSHIFAPMHSDSHFYIDRYTHPHTLTYVSLWFIFQLCKYSAYMFWNWWSCQQNLGCFFLIQVILTVSFWGTHIYSYINVLLRQIFCSV